MVTFLLQSDDPFVGYLLPVAGLLRKEATMSWKNETIAARTWEGNDAKQDLQNKVVTQCALENTFLTIFSVGMHGMVHQTAHEINAAVGILFEAEKDPLPKNPPNKHQMAGNSL